MKGTQLRLHGKGSWMEKEEQRLGSIGHVCIEGDCSSKTGRNMDRDHNSKDGRQERKTREAVKRRLIGERKKREERDE